MQGFLPVLVWEMEMRVGRVGPGVAKVEGEKYKDVEVAEGGVAHSASEPQPQAANGVPQIGTLGEKIGWQGLAADVQLTQPHQQEGVVQVHQ